MFTKIGYKMFANLFRIIQYEAWFLLQYNYHCILSSNYQIEKINAGSDKMYNA